MDLKSSESFRMGDRMVFPLQGVIKGPAGSARVQPRVMSVLIALAQREGRVVTRDEIMSDVWGPVVVSDESLTRCISELRTALGDDRVTPRFVQTIPKIGYRLLEPVDQVDGRDPSRADADSGKSQSVELPDDQSGPLLTLLAYVEIDDRRSEGDDRGGKDHGGHGYAARVLQQAGNRVLMALQEPGDLCRLAAQDLAILRGALCCGDVAMDDGLPVGHAVARLGKLLQTADSGQLLISPEVAQLWPQTDANPLPGNLTWVAAG